MKVGKFNIHDYLNRLNEKAEDNSGETQTGGKEGMVIPPESQKAYQWLKGEFQKNQHEVKVEMSSYEFNTGYSTEGAQDFKEGIYTTNKTAQSYEQEDFGGKNNNQNSGNEGNNKKDTPKSATSKGSNNTSGEKSDKSKKSKDKNAEAQNIKVSFNKK